MKLPPGQFPSEFSFDKNGIRDWKGPEALNMMASYKALPTFVMFYHPLCPWCKRVFEEWVKLGKEFNVDGTGVSIEAVNGSYSATREEIGVKTFPDFRLFVGGNPYGLHMPKDPSSRTVAGFTKFLKENGIGKTHEKPSAAPIKENEISDVEDARDEE